MQPLTPAPEPSERQCWIDYAKALAIALVVFGHASRSVERTDGLVWSDGLRLADGLVYSFHIPLFFILAGVTAGLLRRRDLNGQLRGLYWGILVPYVIWTAVWVGLKLAFPESVNHPLGAWDFLAALWQPVEHMWFLQHLIIARLFWLVVERMGSTALSPASGSFIITALLAAGVMLTPLGGSWGIIGPILGNAAFVGMGLVWLPALVQRRNSAWLLTAAVLAGMFWYGTAVLVRPSDWSLTGVLVAMAGSFTAVALVWRLGPPAGLLGRSVAFVGEASLAIFVMHSIVIGLARAILAQMGWLDETTLLIAGTVLGIVVPAVLFWLVLALSSRAGAPLARWLGLGTSGRSHYLPFGAPQPVARVAAPIRF